MPEETPLSRRNLLKMLPWTALASACRTKSIAPSQELIVYSGAPIRLTAQATEIFIPQPGFGRLEIPTPARTPGTPRTGYLGLTLHDSVIAGRKLRIRTETDISADMTIEISSPDQPDATPDLIVLKKQCWAVAREGASAPQEFGGVDQLSVVSVSPISGVCCSSLNLARAKLIDVPTALAELKEAARNSDVAPLTAPAIANVRSYLTGLLSQRQPGTVKGRF